MRLTVALILTEWAAGLLAGLALVHRVSRVGVGFTWLLGGVAAGVAGFGAVVGRHESGAGPVWRLSLALAVAAVALGEVVMARRRPVALDAVAFAVSTAAAVAAGVAAGGGALTVARAVAGAAFLGAVTVGMVIGHWYLVDPRLPRSLIRRITIVFLGTVVAEAALLLPHGMGGQLSASHRIGFAAVLPVFWVALLVLTAVLGVAVLGALRERSYASVMAATGLLYLAIITAFGVEILGKALITRAL